MLEINQWIIVSLGILLLISIDMLYKPVQWKRKRKQHSASVILIALLIIFYSVNGLGFCSFL